MTSNTPVPVARIEDVVAICKSRGIVLDTTWDGETWQLARSVVHPAPEGMGYLCRLIDANPSPSMPYLETHQSEPVTDLLVTLEMFNDLNEQLRQSTITDIRRVSRWPFQRTFVYLDISDFSKYPHPRQHLVINQITHLLKHISYERRFPEERDAFESMICIGDGYLLVFADADRAVVFAANIGRDVEERNAKDREWLETHFRIGVHTGDVNAFWDPGRGDWNFVGDGVNGGRRVLDAMGAKLDDAIFVSSQTREALIGTGAEKHRKAMENRGRHKDKHGGAWRIYLLNHAHL